MLSDHHHVGVNIIHFFVIYRHGNVYADRITYEAHINMLVGTYWSRLQLIVMVVELIEIQINAFLKQPYYSLTWEEVPNCYSDYALLSPYWA